MDWRLLFLLVDTDHDFQAQACANALKLISTDMYLGITYTEQAKKHNRKMFLLSSPLLRKKIFLIKSSERSG